MAIVLDMDAKEASKENGVYDKLQEARKDASKLLRKEDSYMDVSALAKTHCHLHASAWLWLNELKMTWYIEKIN